MGTSEDRPYLDVVYKLCEMMNKKGKFSPVMKLSKGKVTLPGRKQVFRFKDNNGYFVKDVIALDDEKIDGEPLLIKMVDNGKILYDFPSLEEIRAKANEGLSLLPEKFKKMKNAPNYPVATSRRLKKLINELIQELKHAENL
jgi:nicotinate phosphoribosyltransferase